MDIFGVDQRIVLTAFYSGLGVGSVYALGRDRIQPRVSRDARLQSRAGRHRQLGRADRVQPARHARVHSARGAARDRRRDGGPRVRRGADRDRAAHPGAELRVGAHHARHVGRAAERRGAAVGTGPTARARVHRQGAGEPAGFAVPGRLHGDDRRRRDAGWRCWSSPTARRSSARRWWRPRSTANWRNCGASTSGCDEPGRARGVHRRRPRPLRRAEDRGARARLRPPRHLLAGGRGDRRGLRADAKPFRVPVGARPRDDAS